MKTKYLILILLCVTINLSLNNVIAQIYIDDITQSISHQLEGSDIEEIDDLKSIVDEANQMTEELIVEDERLSKYFAKKKKKGEKKAVGAKQYRIDAMNSYYEGLLETQGVLANRLNFAIFEYPDDQSKVDNLKSRSNDLLTTVRENLVSFVGLDKKSLTALGYDDLKTELESNLQMMLGSIDLIKDGFVIWESQVAKKAKEEEENSAWEKAVNINTIEGFNEYISSFPRGKFVTEANSKIAGIEDLARMEDENRKKAEAERLAELERQRKLAEEQAAQPVEEEPEELVITGLTYSIQIMAVYFKVDEERLKAIYTGDEVITERFEESMYKYSIGTFESFNDAREFRKSLSIPSFIIAFQDGERIPTNDAKRQEQGSVEGDLSQD